MDSLVAHMADRAAGRAPVAHSPDKAVAMLVASAGWHSQGLILGGVAAGLVVIGLAVFFILRSTGAIGGDDPATVVKNYYTDLFVNYDAQSAYNLECPTLQAQATLKQLQEFTSLFRASGGAFDISHLTYTTTDQSGSVAHVTVGGQLISTINGSTTTQAVTGAGTQVTLNKSGSSWCITTNTLGGGTSNHFPIASPFVVQR